MWKKGGGLNTFSKHIVLTSSTYNKAVGQPELLSWDQGNMNQETH